MCNQRDNKNKSVIIDKFVCLETPSETRLSRRLLALYEVCFVDGKRDDFRIVGVHPLKMHDSK